MEREKYENEGRFKILIGFFLRKIREIEANEVYFLMRQIYPCLNLVNILN